MSKKTGLFFGSFNPVHIGHMIIANYMATRTELEEVWMVVSPHNPLKSKSSLAGDYDRLHLVQLAIGDNLRLKASDVEFGLPRPSYTIETLAHLTDKYPDREFCLIMGSDNLDTLHRWKNYNLILAHHHIYAYMRPGHEVGELADHPHVHMHEAPLMQISASYIRRCLREGLSVQYLVPDAVRDYLEKSGLYRH